MTDVIQNTTEVEVQTPPVVIPENSFVKANEDHFLKEVASNFNFFQLNSLIKSVRELANPLHLNLKKKSRVFIFGAGGTTSWFLPKLLKIYNDAFHKVPSLRYPLEIVLIDADIV